MPAQPSFETMYSTSYTLHSYSPFARFGIIPLGGRSTAIKLANGDVWVMASTPLDEPTKATLAKMGPVRYIVGADSVHHLYLGAFLDLSPAFPRDRGVMSVRNERVPRKIC